MFRLLGLCLVLVVPGLRAGDSLAKEDCLVVKATFDVGMFSIFRYVLGALEMYEKGDCSGVKIDLDAGRYLDPAVGMNWWEYFFYPIEIGNTESTPYFCELNDYGSLLLRAMPKGVARSHELIERYVHLKPEISDAVDAYAKRHFTGYHMIGVHHRGTDKVTEHPIVPYKKTYSAIKKTIKKLPDSFKDKVRFFVATDEQAFLDYMKSKFPGKVIHGRFTRSKDHNPLHAPNIHEHESPYVMGKEALLDCLLLSRCHSLVRPHFSCLSLVSVFFNPTINVTSIKK